jgi:2,3-bisphosphoglycerate-independent phosphoglycerate mutase
MPKQEERDSRTLILIILDGWGIAPPSKYNAITLAKKPAIDALIRDYGMAELCASGPCVGLADGMMGNSEVGHLTIGAGRIIPQDALRIDEAVKSGELAKNKTLLKAMASVRSRGSTLHLIGLLSDGGVHSRFGHLKELLRIAKANGAANVAVDAILDGRDSPPRSSKEYLTALIQYMGELGTGMITTLSGRYYTMDRDKHWERTKIAYDAIVRGVAERFKDPIASIDASYEMGVTDEFIVPVCAYGYNGMADDDVAILFNFRPDRMRQFALALSKGPSVLGEPESSTRVAARPGVISMVQYGGGLGVPAMLRRLRVADTISSVLDHNGISQLHIAETEKYAHVTYFFNGLVEKPLRLEERILIPSKRVATYDTAPEMRAPEITERLVNAIEHGTHRFLLANLANADMVGHTGNLGATIKAVETIDSCIALIERARASCRGGADLIITADHGNAEKMFDEARGQPHTAHTTAPVPMIVVSEKWALSVPHGYAPGLRDIAPTALEMLELSRPAAMTGRPLIVGRARTF